MRKRIAIWCGWWRETIHRPRNVRRVTPEVHQVDCWECGGTGDWTPFHPEPHMLTEQWPCIACKGTGRQYV